MKQTKTNIFRAVLALLIGWVMLPYVAQAQEPVIEDGTEAHPFLIESEQELWDFHNCMVPGSAFYFYNGTYSTKEPDPGVPYKLVNTGGKNQYFKLTTDVFLNKGNVAGCDGVRDSSWKEWTPMEIFNGHFDGDYHVVSGMFCTNRDESALYKRNERGFFTQINDHATVSHLGIVNAYVYGAKAVGGIAGWLLNSSTISECFFEGTIESTDKYTGGIVGICEQSSHIENCYSSGRIYATLHYVGGIVGQNATYSEVLNCYANMMIQSDGSMTGAVCGNDSISTITNCFYDKQLSTQNNNMLAAGKLTAEMTTSSWTELGAPFVKTNGLYPYINGFDLNKPAVAMSVIPIFLNAVSSSQYDDVDNVTTSFTLGSRPGFTWTAESWNNAITLDGLTANVNKQGIVDLVIHYQDTITRTYILIPKKAPFLGEESNPFTIDNLTDLTNFRDGINGGLDFIYKRIPIAYTKLPNVHWLQTADIDMSSLAHLNAKGNMTSDWKPIGNTSSFQFTGHYHGGNHKILNFTVPSYNNDNSTVTYYALFGYAKNAFIEDLTFDHPSLLTGSGKYRAILNASNTYTHIKNCHVLNGNITTTGAYCGAICAQAEYSFIRDCSVENTTLTSDAQYLGGILGSGLSDTLINCYTKGGKLKSTYIHSTNYCYSGGICGYMTGVTEGNACDDHYQSIFDSCYNEIPLSAQSSYIGGICGYASRATEFIHCYNKANVTSDKSYVGGIVGSTNGSPHFRYCYNSGNIVGNGYLGGILGSSSSSNTATLSFACFNTGSVLGSSNFVGGICGYSYIIWKDLFNCGLVKGVSNIGGCLGHNNSSCQKLINIGLVFGEKYYIGSVVGYPQAKPKQVFNDRQICQLGPANNEANNTDYIQMKTEDMLGDGMKSKLTEEYWEFTSGMYPRIKYWKDADAAIVAATPLLLTSADQDCKNVKEDFYLAGCDSNVVWHIDSGAVVDHIDAVCSNNQCTAVLTPGGAIDPTYLSASRNGVTYKLLQVEHYVKPIEDTLTIDSLGDLITLQKGVNSGKPFYYHNDLLLPRQADSCVFRLTTDIAMPDSNWVPIGNLGLPFKALALLGDNHVVSNLYSSTSDTRETGLIGTYSGTVRDLHLTDVAITGGAYQGSICARLLTGGSIVNCTAHGVIFGGSAVNIPISTTTYHFYVGGIVGYAESNTKIENCINYVKIDASETNPSTSYAGGIVGVAQTTSSSITLCANKASVTASKCVGGITGSSGKITQCYNTGDITGTPTCIYIGGINGSGASIAQCYNEGIITAMSGNSSANNYVGGISGDQAPSYCYNAGIIYGNNRMYVGGISGSGKPKYCYNSNTVRGTGTYLGSITGAKACDAKCYYDKQMSNAGACNGTDVTGTYEALGKSTEEMLGTGLQSVLGASASTIASTWYFEEGKYPQLRCFAGTAPSVASVMPVMLGAHEGGEELQTWNHIDQSFQRSAGDWELQQGVGCVRLEGGETHPVMVTGLGIAVLGAKVNDTVYRKDRLLININENNPFIIKNETEMKNFRDVINQNGYYKKSDQTYHVHLTAADSSNLEDFVEIENGGLDMFFKLTADLDFASETEPWLPVGDYAHDESLAFEGTLDGDGHTIRHLKIGDGSYQGLFGQNKGTIHDLMMISCTITGTGSHKGLMCGSNNGGILRNCAVNNSNVSGSSYRTGVLCGSNMYADIISCSISYDTLTSVGDSVGGIAGCSYYGVVDTCYADHLYVSVKGKFKGGIVGTNEFGTIRKSDILNSYYDVSGQYTGGICGFSQGGNSKIIFCRNINTEMKSSSDFLGGILGALETATKVYNCESYNGNIISTASYVGGISGQINKSSDSVNYCVNQSLVQGNANVGGIAGFVGHSNPKLYYNVNTGKIICNGSNVGGICGQVERDPVFRYSYNTGDVKGTNSVGGIVGLAHGTIGVFHVENCFNEGMVLGTNCVGGILGDGNNDGTRQFAIIQSYNVGIVKGISYVGGLVGAQNANQREYSRFSYNAGYVSGINMVGSICGYSADNSNKFDHCFYDRQMSAWGGINDIDVEATVPKLTSEMTATAFSSELDTSATPAWTFIEGMYPQIRKLDTTRASITSVAPVFLTANDSVLVRANDVPVGRYGLGGCDSVQWTSYDGYGLTIDGCDTADVFGRNYVRIANTMDGDTFKVVQLVLRISEVNPLEIVNLEQFKNFRNLINTNQTFYYDDRTKIFYANEDESYVKIKPGGEDMYFKLTTDIDLSLETENWVPIGNYATTNAETKTHIFRGHFNGGGHTIKGLHIKNNSAYQALFGYSMGTVKNVRMENTTVTGSSKNTGGYHAAIVGYNKGAVLHCSSVGGSIQGSSYIGGITGENFYAQVSYCYNNANVSGKDNLGGITGRNYTAGLITQCFNTGLVNVTNASGYAGGIAGQSSSEVSNCYNAGAISGWNYLGGVVGYSQTPLVSHCYNVGLVLSSSAVPSYVGAVVSTNNASYYPKYCYYDRQMSTLTGGVGNASTMADNINSTTGYFTADFLGNALSAGLDSTYWTFTDSIYPRLKSMDTLDASIASVQPVYLPYNLKCLEVDFPFTVKTNDSIEWSRYGTGNSLELSHIDEGKADINVCGHDTLKVSLNKDYKLIPLYVGKIAATIQCDTACDGFFLWEANGRIYTKSDSITLALTVLDGCDSILTLKLTIPPTIVLDIESQSYPCYESDNAYAIAHVTGGFNRGYYYEWTNEDGIVVGTDSLLDKPEPGIYYITVRDSIHPQCDRTGEVEITRPTELILTETGHDTKCFNTDDGFIAFQVEGGVSPYTVKYSATDSLEEFYDPSVDTFRTLPAGMYTIYVTDAHGCYKEVENIDLNEDATPYSLSAFAVNKLYDGDTINPYQYVLKIGDGESVTYASGDTVALSTGDSLYAVVSLTDTILKDACQKKNKLVEYAIFNNGEDRTCRYNLIDADMEQDVIISKRRVIIESLDSSKAYDGQPLTNHTILISGDGFAHGEDTMNCVVTGTQTDVGYSLNEFTYELTPVTDANNYEIIKKVGVLVVGSHDTIIVITPNSSKTYDGDSLYDRRYTSTGDILATDSLVVQINASITDAGSTPNAITSYKIIDKISKVDHTGNYKFGTPVIGTLTVNRRPVTLLSPSASKVYDGMPLNGTSTVTVLGDGFVAGEVTSCTAQTLTEADTIENTIEITKGANYKDDNYDLTITPGTLAISKRPLEITGQSSTVVYTGQEHSITTYNAAVVSGHTVSNLAYLAKGTVAGTYPGEFSGTVLIRDAESNDVTHNYEITQTPGTLTINQSEYPLVVKSASDSVKYDGELHTFQTYTVFYNGQVLLPAEGTFVYTLPTNDKLTVTPKDAGLGIKHVRESGPNAFSIELENAANYASVTLDSGTVKILKRSVELRSSTERMNYDGVTNLPKITSDASVSRVGEGFVVGEDVTCTYTGYQKNAGTSRNTFTYEPKAGTDTSDYKITCTFGNLTVNKVRLTVTPTDAERLYGEPDPELHYTITGFKNNEDTLHGAPFIGTARPVLITTATSSSPIGIYDIKVDLTGVTFANYTVTAGTGTFTIYPRSITIQAYSLPTRAYDGYAHSWQETDVPHYSFDGTGLMPGDSITSVIIAGSRTVAGVGQIELNNAKVEHFEIDGDDTVRTDVTSSYTTTYKSGTITITPVELKLKPKHFEHDFTGYLYNSDSTEAPHFDIVGGALVGNDTVAQIGINGYRSSYGKTPFVIDSASIKIVNRDDVAEVIQDSKLHNAGYHITFETDTLVINHRSEPYVVRMEGKDAEMVYDGTDHRLTGWKNAKFVVEGFTYYADSTNFISKVENKNNVGEYRTYFSGAFRIYGANGEEVTTEFKVDIVPGHLVITPRPLTMTAKGVDVEYDYVEHSYTDNFPNFYTAEGLCSTFDVIYNPGISGKRTNVGRTPIHIEKDSVVIHKIATGADITSNYVIVTKDSAIHIRDREVKDTIVFTSKSNTLTYDGEEHTLMGFDTLNFTLIGHNASHTPVVFRIDPSSVSATAGTVSAAGTYDNVITGTPVLKDANDSIVTTSFIILADTGKLVINQRPITVTARDTTFYYDGENHNFNEMSEPRYTIDSTQLLSGHELSAHVTSGTIRDLDATTPMEVGNVIIKDASHNNVTDNYAITKVNGLLKIEGFPGAIVITSASAELECTGLPQKKEEYTVSYDGTPITAVTGSNGLRFTLPTATHDTLTITPTFAGITTPSENADSNNVYTYTLQNDTKYVGTRTLVKGTIVMYDSLKVVVTPTAVTCYGLNDGKADVTVTGGKKNAGNYSYKLDGGEATNTTGAVNLTNLSNGSHTFYVSDSLSYNKTVTFTITQPDTLTLTLTSDNPVCDDGSVMSYTTGGNGGNTYKLNGVGTSATYLYNHLGEGDYTVTVTDSKGCSATQSVTLTAIPVTAKEGVTRHGEITDYAPDTTVNQYGERTNFPALTANGEIIAQPTLSNCTAAVSGHTVTLSVDVESIGVLPILEFELSKDESFSTTAPMYTHKVAPVSVGEKSFDFENLPAGTYYVRAKLYNCAGGYITAAPATATVTVE